MRLEPAGFYLFIYLGLPLLPHWRELTIPFSGGLAEGREPGGGRAGLHPKVKGTETKRRGLAQEGALWGPRLGAGTVKPWPQAQEAGRGTGTHQVSKAEQAVRGTGGGAGGAAPWAASRAPPGGQLNSGHQGLTLAPASSRSRSLETTKARRGVAMAGDWPGGRSRDRAGGVTSS